MNDSQTEQLDEKASHYLTEIFKGNHFIHDKEAYSLFKTILERFYRNSKDCFAKIGFPVFEEDCYYEGYDSKGNLQRASFWLPLELLSCSTLYEAFYLSCSFRSPESAASYLMRRIDQEMRREGTSVDKLYGFFRILYRTLVETDIPVYIGSRDKFRAFFSGRVNENDLSAYDLRAGFFAFSKSNIPFQTKGIIYLRNLLLTEDIPCAPVKLGYVTGVDFSDGVSVAEFVTNIDIDIDLDYQCASNHLSIKNRDFIVKLHLNAIFYGASLSFSVRGIKSLKVKTEINSIDGYICEHTLTYSLPRLKLTDFKPDSYKKHFF